MQIVEFVRLDVLALTLGEAIQKNRTVAFFVRNDHAIATGSAGSRPRHALFDQAAAEFGIN